MGSTPEGSICTIDFLFFWELGEQKLAEEQKREFRPYFFTQEGKRGGFLVTDSLVGEVQFLSDLLVGELLEIGHDEDFTEPGCKVLQLFTNLRQHFGLENLAGEGVFIVQIDIRKRFVTGLFPLPASEYVQAGVADGAIKKVLNMLAVIKFRCFLPELYEHIGSGIFRCRFILEDTLGKSTEDREIEVNERLQGLRVLVFQLYGNM